MKYNNIFSTAMRWCAGMFVMGLMALSTPGATAQVVVHGNVFGGGNAATVSGNTSVLMQGTTATVGHCVYGGGALAAVGTASGDQTTTVSIEGGRVNESVYGGGLGDANNAADVGSNVTVNIGRSDDTPTETAGVTSYNSVVIGENVFGANNQNGTPSGNIVVNIYHTAHNATNQVSTFANVDALVAANHDASYFAIQGVYGGGNEASYTPAASCSTTVTIYGCENTVKMVYGGGRAANVGTSGGPLTNAIVEVQGGRIDTLFAGGDGHTLTHPGQAWNATTNPYRAANIFGDATAFIHGGYYTAAFAGSNTSGTISGTQSLTIDKDGPCSSQEELIGSLFGGGNMADVNGDISLTVACGAGKFKEIYGGANMANINNGNVTLNIFGGTMTNVYGGSKGVADDPNTVADESVAANIDGNVTLNLYGGTVTNAFGGSNQNGNITGNITVNVLDKEATSCELHVTNLYGAGNVTAYSPTDANATSPVVNLIHIKNNNGTEDLGVSNDVFGGGLGLTATVTANPVVNIGYDATTQASILSAVPGGYTQHSGFPLAMVGNNVYGGGSLASVEGSTTVNVRHANTVIKNTIYGAGKGDDHNPAAAQVTENATVHFSDGNVWRSIYGGGEIASVGTFTEYYTQKVEPTSPAKADGHVIGEPKTFTAGTGLTSVYIHSGIVGKLNANKMPNPSALTTEDDWGYIFCAGKGIGDSTFADINGVAYAANRLAVSCSSYFYMEGGLVTASIYGGSENGQVLGNTYVEIAGGQVGTGYYNDGSDHWDGIYASSAWETVLDKVRAGTFEDADAAGFHFCDAWPYNAEGTRYTYDHYATHYNSSDKQYYYDAGFTQSAHNGAVSAGDGHSFFGHVFGGGSGYYPFRAGEWRRSAGRVLGNTHVEITGGHILTNVYGGNEITDVMGSSTVVMTGGTLGVPRTIAAILGRPVNCNLFGAGMGDPRVMFNQWSNVGSTSVTVGGTAVVFGSVFGGGEDGHVLGDASTTIGGTAVIGTTGGSGLDGNVYGGGRGFSAWALTAGVVSGNVTLNVQDNAKIHGSIYGGGRMAAVGTYLVPEGHADYGAMQAGSAHGNVAINISGGTVGNSHKMGGSTTSIGDVFGGSKGILGLDFARDQKLGLVKNTTVTISQADGKNTHILGNVYGGGEIASVGHYQYATTSTAETFMTQHPGESMAAGDVYDTIVPANAETIGKATILITGGTIGTAAEIGDAAQIAAYTHREAGNTLYKKGFVFGGCLGRSGTGYSGYSFVTNSKVRIEGGTVMASLFGGGENGHVFNSTDVQIAGGQVGQELDVTEHAEDDNGVGVVENIYFGNVYGGGRGIDKYIDGSTELYSITAGRVNNATNVTMTDGRVTHNVYGGGSLASVGHMDDDNLGTATVSIIGGIVGYAGGLTTIDYTTGTYKYNNAAADYSDNTQKTAVQTFYKYAGNNEGNVYGSGRGHAGDVSDQYVKMAFVKNTHVTIGGTAQVRGSVFGGGENGHVRQSTEVTVAGTAQIGVPLMSIVDWGDDTWAMGDDGYIDHFTLTTGKNSNTSSEYYFQNEGLGRGIHLHEHWVADNGEGPTIYRGNVYGGGRGVTPIDPNNNVSIDAHDYSATAGRVYGNATVYINGGRVYHDVFGGGSLASVGTLVYSIDNNGVRKDPMGNVITGQYNFNKSTTSAANWSETDYELTERPYALGDPVTGTGLVKVYVNGGIIGTDGINNGGVFGSGRGIAGTHTSRVAHLANANNTEVYLRGANGTDANNTVTGATGADVRATVFGGGANGHVTQNTYVEMTGGTVGTPLPLAVRKIDERTGHGYRNYTGNVYGGGRGVSIIASTEGSQAEHLSETAGRVFGNTKVLISGGHVYHSVFGGGSLASVGSYSYRNFGDNVNPDYRHLFIQGTGQAVVHITGDAHIGNLATDLEVTGAISAADAKTAKYVLRNQVDNATWHGKTESEADDLWTALGTAGQQEMLTELNYHYLGSNSGMVFGSGRGVGALSNGTVDKDYINSAFTRNTIVIVDNDGDNIPVICGSVFGGGENGHVKINTHVDINGGIIGGIPLHNKSFHPGLKAENGIALSGSGYSNFHFSNDGSLVLSLEYEDSENEAGHGPAVYRGNVYGGGRGVDHTDSQSPETGYSATAGRVYGDAEVNVTGGMIYHHVFGGGSLASVGTYVEQNGYPHHADSLYEYQLTAYNSSLTNSDFSDTRKAGKYAPRHNDFPTDGSELDTIYVLAHDKTGEVKVNVSGGQIGVTGVNEGSVFGGGRGIAGANNATVTHLAYCLNTDVKILNGSDIRGSVFGGGANGHVLTNSKVTMTGGTVGVQLSNTEREINSYGEATHKVFHGNVYGGGRGVDPIGGTGHNFSYTAGRVYGNAVVAISGGTVWHNVYGGGSLATVGTIHYKTQADIDAGREGTSLAPTSEDPEGTMKANTGSTTVTISGGTIGDDGMNNGSVFGSCRGVAGPNYNDRAYVYTTEVNISGGAIHGSVFGSGENGHVQNNTEVNISGGTIGTALPNDYANLSDENKKKYDFIGNVYGAGRGVDAYKDAGNNDTYSMSAGYVRNNTTVNVTGGTIYRNVYGGGSMGLVGDYGVNGENDAIASSGTDAEGKPIVTSGITTVNIHASVGTAANVAQGYGGCVFGSSRGVANDPADPNHHDFADMAYVFKTQVNIGNDAGSESFTVHGNVYGGGEAGHVDWGGTTVNIMSGTVSGSVFGGGMGSSTSPTAGIVDGPTQVNIGLETQGGNNVVIGGNVFGGNDAGSSPLGTMRVDVWHTGHTAANTCPDLSTLTDSEKEALLVESTAENRNYYAIEGVYGGGNKASTLTGDPAIDAPGWSSGLNDKYIQQRLNPSAYTNPAWPGDTSRLSQVVIHGCKENTVQYVYGGGRAANTLHNEVLIEGGRVYRAFAGGDGHTTDPSSGAYLPANVKKYTSGITSSGDASLVIKGGIVYQAFGGSNTSGYVEGTASVSVDPEPSCPLLNDEIFGGGNQAPGGSVVVTIPCGVKGLDDVYGGANEAPITGDVTLNILGGEMKRAFGGSKNAPITGNVTVNVYGGSIGELYGGNNIGGNITGTITVNVDWGLNDCEDPLKLGYVFGGGRQAPYEPTDVAYAPVTDRNTTVTHFTPVVNIIQATVDTAVFGGGFGVGSTATTDAHVSANPKVVIGAYRTEDRAGNTVDEPNNPVRIGKEKNTLGRTLAGNVFGGGNAGPVMGSPTVIIQGSDTKVWHNVYGGGNAATVHGNPIIEIGANPRLSKPQFTLDGSNLTITSHEGATVYYTVGADPADPTNASTEYTGPVSVSDYAGQKVKAIAYKTPTAADPTPAPSPVATFTVPSN